MGHRVESELKEELEKFRWLADAYRIASCPILSGAYLADYLLFEPEFASELIEVDAALRCLHKRIDDPRMQPILSQLFAKLPIEKAIKAWDQALSEIFAFAHFESLGILHSLGWPSDFPGQHAPFDFAIKIEGNILAGDVKPANGSGYRLLEQNLRRCVSEHATQTGVAVPRVTIRYHGPLTQEIVGDNLQQFVLDFKQKIAKHPLSESQTIALTIGSTNLTIILGDTEELGGGITGTSVLSDALAPTFKNHIEDKGRHGGKYDVRFLLAYVRLPGRGLQTSRLTLASATRLQKQLRRSEVPLQIGLAPYFSAPELNILNRGSLRVRLPIGRRVFLARVCCHCLGAILTPVPCFLEDIHEGKQRFSLSYGVWHDDADGE